MKPNDFLNIIEQCKGILPEELCARLINNAPKMQGVSREILGNLLIRAASKIAALTEAKRRILSA